MKPRRVFLASPFSLVLIFFLLITISLYVEKASSDEEQHVMPPHVGSLVKKGQRRTLFVTEYGTISAADVLGGHGAPFHHLQFFTLDPNSLFLPVLLHADMVFYVHTGSGRLSWANEDRSGRIGLRKGDLCKLSEGSVFYIQSNLEPERKKLRIYALFANTDDNIYDPLIGAYSRINDLVKGFDRRTLQAAFKVPEDLVEAITNKTDTPAIVHAAPEEEHHRFWELEASVLRNFIGIPTNTKKVKAYNIHENDPDFKNPHGWTLTVTKKQLKTLKDTDIGFFMVNLTQASMLGPHWNPGATEIAVVLQGEGMVRVTCGSSSSNDDNDNTEECQNKRFRVKEGDVFVVPRFHPMAHMSFNNDSLVFMGFSTTSKENYPQFLAGKTSMLRMLDKEVMAMSLGVSNTTIDQLLGSQNESTIFGCVSCAEEEEKIMEEEIEERRREEEEKRRREEEEARKREEERRREEEEKKEEEAKRQEEEEKRRREEEEARKREEERRREEEEKKEEEAKRQEEEAMKEMERRKREEEEEAARREQEEAKREQEKRERERQEEEEEQARKEEERIKQEEKARREIEKRMQEEEAQRELERRRQEAEAAAREQEQEQARREQEKRRREKETEREQERAREEEEEKAIREEEQARKEEERIKQEEKARREIEKRMQEEEAQRELERRRQEAEAAAREQEQEQARREQEKRRREEETEREQERAREEVEEKAIREQERAREEEEEEKAIREQEQGRRQQERGEKRPQEGEERARQEQQQGEGEEPASEWEWEQAEARRQQEEREKRRQHEGDNHKSMPTQVKEAKGFEGRRVLKKMQNV